MNIQSKAIQIADEAGAPQNVASIQRQIEMNLDARRRAHDFAVRWYGASPVKFLVTPKGSSLEFAKRIAGNCLNDEERAGLMIYLLDSIPDVGSDLRVEAECVLADVLSGVRT